MATPYQKGRRIEYRCKRELAARGCLVVRSAGSHTKFDLIAINPATRTILLIQCKARELRPSELRRLAEELRKYEGVYEVKACVYAKFDGRYRLVEVGSIDVGDRGQ